MGIVHRRQTPTRQLTSEETSEVTSKVDAAIAAGTKCVAIYAFDAQTPDDLAFTEGDIILATDTSDDWWYGYIFKKGYDSFHGQFPSNYVQIYEDETTEEN